MKKHELLPDTMTPEALAGWIQERFIEEYSEEKKEYYTPEEIQGFQKKATEKNIEIIQLTRLKKQLNELIKKGSDYLSIDIPKTDGIDMLTAARDYNTEQVEQGYYTESRKIYGIVSDETETLEFFDIEGDHVLDRSRPLSPREINEHIGLLAPSLRRASN